MIEEIVILGAVFLVAVDETFYEPEKARRVNAEDEL